MTPISRKIEEAFKIVNQKNLEELNLSGLKLNDKMIQKLSSKLKTMKKVSVVKIEKNLLSGNILILK